MSEQQQILLVLVATHTEDSHEQVAQHPALKSSKEVETVSNYILKKILPALPHQNHKRILIHNNNEYSYRIVDNRAFFCVTRPGSLRALANDLLEDVEGFVETRGVDPEDLRIFLKGKFEYYNDTSNHKIYNLKQKVDSVKDQMIVNIDRLLERGEKLESILEVVEELSNDADEYRRRAKKVKHQMCKKYIMIAVALALVIFAIFIVLIFIACGFPTFHRCIRK